MENLKTIMTLLEVKNINLGFNTEMGFKKAVSGVSFELQKGEVLAIVGESGCGKTLTAMSILSLLPKNCQMSEGEIYFSGENLLQGDIIKKYRGGKIALIPQDPMTSLNPLYTIENQLLEVIELHQNLKGEKAREVALEALKKVKIPDAKERLKAYPHELSGGMKQRVIIAMALATNADLIIADEPTTALDVTVQAQIMKLLHEIKENEKTSIILITHDLALVCENADKIAVMYAGKIVETASRDELFTSPKHPYTKALFEALPDMSKETLSTIEGQPPSINETISGCTFHPRCKFCMQICTEKYPDEFELGQSKVACWLYSEQ